MLVNPLFNADTTIAHPTIEPPTMSRTMSSDFDLYFDLLLMTTVFALIAMAPQKESSRKISALMVELAASLEERMAVLLEQQGKMP